MNVLSEKIKKYAAFLGFDACGFSKAEKIPAESKRYTGWLKQGYNAGMGYMSDNLDKRFDPALLVEDTKSIISLALNYYPKEKIPAGNPRIAYYAYGKDYHEVMKSKMNKLFDFIKKEVSGASGRCFCDTAPVLERYWATRSGIGFTGKNTSLIIPGKGSYFFLGEIFLNIELAYDNPSGVSCGKCKRCMEACPTKALNIPYILDSNRCISYQTIENKNEIAEDILPHLNNCVYGCDICQQVCPWNRSARPNDIEEFTPLPDFLSLNMERLDNMTVEEYRKIFKNSAVKRAKYSGLKRNIEALKKR